jgi:tRNA A37 threonylcarbamoyladenosine biosynthesis protein TsaE
VADLALGELAEDRGVVLVEWGDVVAGVLGDHLTVRLETVPDMSAGVADPDVDDGAERSADEQRDITIAGVGRSWATRWASLEAALREVAASC